MRLGKFVFLGFRRGGSSISFMIFQNLLLNSGLYAEDVVGKYHEQGVPIDQIPPPVLEEAFVGNNLVGCFRCSPQVLEKIAVDDLRPILVIRDPRDCQYSWFYARYLHTMGELASIPIEGSPLHEQLCQEDNIIGDIRDLLAFTRKHNGLILRYEDMVLEPATFLQKFIDFTGLPITRSALDTAIVMANFVQIVRNSKSHNRSGAPFDALRTLPHEMLVKLNERFGALVVDMGYPLWPDEASVIDLAPLLERDAQKRFMMTLAEENGYRINEVRELHGKLVDQVQELAELKHENGLRIDGIRQVKHGLEAARISIAALRQKNGYRIDEIKGLNEIVSRHSREMAELRRENGFRIEDIRQLTSGFDAVERRFLELESEIGYQANKIRALEDAFAQTATASITSLIIARIKRHLGLRFAQEIQGGEDGPHKIV